MFQCINELERFGRRAKKKINEKKKIFELGEFSLLRLPYCFRGWFCQRSETDWTGKAFGEYTNQQRSPILLLHIELDVYRNNEFFGWGGKKKKKNGSQIVQVTSLVVVAGRFGSFSSDRVSSNGAGNGWT